MKTPIQDYNFLDQCIMHFDLFLKNVRHHPQTTGRINPADGVLEPVLSEKERRHAAGLIRVNHAGEISAQALYQAQALVSRSTIIKDKMQAAAIEEGDHLAWCYERLMELGSHPSYLNVFWYTGAFMIGMAAGFVGDRWSLGFVYETEQQVVEHLEKHLTTLPVQDLKSQKILTQMQIDEAEHRDAALDAGGEELPFFIKKCMKAASSVMVKLAYWI